MAMVPDAFLARLCYVLDDLMMDEGPALPDDVRSLLKRLWRIRSFVVDAVRRQAVEGGPVEDWLAELKEVLYDADDFVDSFIIDRRRSSDEPRRQPLRPSWACCPRLHLRPLLARATGRNDPSPTPRDINARLEKIARQRDQLRLKELSIISGLIDTKERRATSSSVELDVVGVEMEDDRNRLVTLLTKDDRREMLVHAIVGMGGIGKTTLAQMIFNDERVKAGFSISMWVLVSQNYSEVDLLKDILHSAGGRYHAACNKAELLDAVREYLEQKRFLLVLDDVWHPEIWLNLLKFPLENSAGSRILVTTRDENVARQMRAVFIYRMRPLSVEDSWLLLSKMVSSDVEGIDIQELKDVGLKIIDKCGGNPLAIKAIAGYLRSGNLNHKGWKKLLEDEIWSLGGKDIMRPLLLSYEHLPSRLKQCFVYCSLFPKNYVMTRRDLIRLWIAEGFIRVYERLTLEEVAEQYFDELVSRSFLQLEPDNSNEVACSMHDLLRDLALSFLSPGESASWDLSGSSTMSPKLRRLSIVDAESAPDVLPTEQVRLRTLFIINSPVEGTLLCELDRFVYLRVLDLRGTEIQELPNSLGNLVHLRYLNLSRTRIYELPSSINFLKNMQFLNVNRCVHLHSLPSSLSQLSNLRGLDLLSTKVDQMPTGIGRLKYLNSLMGFVVDNKDKRSEHKPSGCSLEELASLTGLRELCIRNLERAFVKENKGLDLRDNNHLKLLVLECKTRIDSSKALASYEIDGLEKVFEQLHLPQSLEELSIEGYFGRYFPSWMLSPSNFPSLMRLDLKDCILCHLLPPLGRFPQLKYLGVANSSAVVKIDSNFFGDGQISFPKLEMLVFEDMTNWEEWLGLEDHGLPCLRVLQLRNCPKLKALPERLQYAKSLDEVVIEAADSMRVVHNLPFLTDLCIRDCPNLERILNLPALRTLSISDCPALKDVDGMGLLQQLRLVDFVMESIPKWLEQLHVVSLDVTGNIDLLKRLEKHGTEWLKVAHISRLYVHTVDKSTYLSSSEGAFRSFSFNTKPTRIIRNEYEDYIDNRYEDSDDELQGR